MACLICQQPKWQKKKEPHPGVQLLYLIIYKPGMAYMADTMRLTCHFLLT